MFFLKKLFLADEDEGDSAISVCCCKESSGSLVKSFCSGCCPEAVTELVLSDS